MNSNLPVLYSFRRCPYAMRARLAIAYSDITVELREVILRDKPAELLAISPKATVPVLELVSGQVLEESLDIIYWVLSINDPDNWLSLDLADEIKQLIVNNDGEFKYYLDRYKYADRYPENNELFYREKAESFISELEQRLSQHTFLCSNRRSLADMAIFPFIRQFANVNTNWFQSSKYNHLKQWLNKHLESDLFISIMEKLPAWQAEDKQTTFPTKRLS
ncbi:MAG: glutathione S-transferase [Methylomarinum sp.]|nr:glutathione S-transferase [Methylomarinum sp.]